jgi:hypothetical protein
MYATAATRASGERARPAAALAWSTAEVAADAAAADEEATSSGEDEEEAVAVAPPPVEATSLAPAEDEPAVVTAPWVAEAAEEVLSTVKFPAAEELVEVASAAEEVPLLAAVEEAEALAEEEALAFSLKFEPWALQELLTESVASSTRSPHLDLRQDLMSPPALSHRQEMLARSLSQSAFLDTSATQASTQAGVVAETRPTAPTAVKIAVENFIFAF